MAIFLSLFALTSFETPESPDASPAVDVRPMQDNRDSHTSVLLPWAVLAQADG